MVSHATYPALDPRAIASQSRAIVTDLLKRRLGFKGVAVTDSIEARAVSGRMTPGRAAIRSIRAGIDLVLTTGPGSHLRVWRALQGEARRDPRFKRRLRDAAARVLSFRRSLPRGAGWLTHGQTDRGRTARRRRGSVLLLVSLFLSWFKTGVNAWEIYEVVDLLLAVAAIAVLLAAAGASARRCPHWTRACSAGRRWWRSCSSCRRCSTTRRPPVSWSPTSACGWRSSARP